MLSSNSTNRTREDNDNMSDGNEWRNQLMESLELRDKIEKANINMFTSCEYKRSREQMYDNY